MSLAAFSHIDCEHHGVNSLARYNRCVCCEKEGRPAPSVKPLDEPIPEWMKKCILGIDSRDAIYKHGRKVHHPTRHVRNGVRGNGKDLSNMERDVFLRLGWGVAPYHIAAQLGVDQKAVSNTITRLLDKHRVGSREQLRAIAKAAARAGE